MNFAVKQIIFNKTFNNFDNKFNISVENLSAKTILVRVTFSIVNLVRPPLPAIRPMARDK
jgi:hypothetical protein